MLPVQGRRVRAARAARRSSASNAPEMSFAALGDRRKVGGKGGWVSPWAPLMLTRAPLRFFQD